MRDPSTPYDAKGLLIQAIRDDDPVIFFEHKALYQTQGDVPDRPYTIPFGEANVRPGRRRSHHRSSRRMVHLALEAGSKLSSEGVECEIIDPRTISPLDEETILESVAKTGRLVVVDEASPRCNMATDISAMVAQKGFGYLRAPIRMVTPPHTPVPFSPILEDLYIPDTNKVIEAVHEVMRYEAWTQHASTH